MRALVISLCLAGSIASAAPDPKAAAHYKQGKAFLDSKQYDQAIVEFEAAYAIDKVSSHLFNIAKAYDAKADYDKAIAYYEKYLDVEPASKHSADARRLIVVATKARAEVQAKKAAEQEAARLTAEAKRLEMVKKRELADAHVKQAKAHAAAGNPSASAAEHVVAFEIDGDSEHLFDAGDAARAAGKDASAKGIADGNIAALALYRRYLDSTPSGPRADAARAQIAILAKEEQTNHVIVADPKLDKPPTKPRSVMVANMAANAKAAAGRGDCRIARRVADQVRAEDPEYHDSVVVPGIAACSETASGSKVKRVGGGLDLRIGMFKTGDFIQSTRPTTPATADPTVGIGIFVDLAALPKLRVRLGVRARIIKARWDIEGVINPEGTCPPATICPSNLSGVFGGPAVSIEPALYRDATSDVHAVLGAGLAIPLNGSNFKVYSEGNEMPGQDVSLNTQVELEIGAGFRSGRFFANALGILTFPTMTDDFEIGSGKAIVVSLGFTTLQ